VAKTVRAWRPYLLLAVGLWSLVTVLAIAEVRSAELVVLAQLAIPARMGGWVGWRPDGSVSAYTLLLVALVSTGGLLYVVVERFLRLSAGGPWLRAGVAWAGVGALSLLGAFAIDQAFRNL
jgi:hypothetical protein